MADIDNILSKLEKLKRTGNGKWLACCPAHEDKSPSLAIKLTDDDKILIHRFSACDVTEIVGVLGLTLAERVIKAENTIDDIVKECGR